MTQQTNVEFVTELMEYSTHGAMAQLFILDAIEKWAGRIAGTPDEKLIEQFGENSFIHPLAWKAVAQEIKTKCEKRYEK